MLAVVRQTSFRDFHCSLARALEVAGDWWSPLIVRDLVVGLHRFDELVEDLGISRNLLTDRLDALVEHGIVTTRPYDGHGRRVEYVLTDAGNELAAVLMALTAWGDRWETPPGGPPIRFHHHGHRCTPAVMCSTCGEPVVVDEITFSPGPGGRVARGTQLIGARLVTGAKQRRRVKP
jgi:DNA-binding HxlR family transcriptional regulator